MSLETPQVLRQDKGDGCKLSENGVGWDSREKSFPGIEFPEQLWLPLDPWNVQFQVGAAWDSGRCPCHGWGGSGWDLRSP